MAGRRRSPNRNRKERRLRLILHAGGRCERCGYTSQYQSAFDFHHPEGAVKRFTLSISNMTRSWDELLAEADVCVLLCACCHRIVHEIGEEGRDQWPLT